jgi:O-antigen ligase
MVVMSSLVTIGTFSRSILGAFIIEILLLILFWRKLIVNKQFLKIVSGVILIYAIALIVLPENLTNLIDPRLYISRIDQTMVKGDESTSIHNELARLAIQLWENNPILGVGFGNFGSSLGGVENALSHSAFLSFLAETGLVGLFVNLLLIIFLSYISYRSIRKYDDNSFWFAVQVGILVGFVGTISGNITYHYYNQPYIWFLMGLITAMSRVLGKISKEKN